MTTDHGGRGGSGMNACPSCCWHERVIAREVRLNVRRESVGRPVDLALIRRSKEAMATCAARGHWANRPA